MVAGVNPDKVYPALLVVAVMVPVPAVCPTAPYSISQPVSLETLRSQETFAEVDVSGKLTALSAGWPGRLQGLKSSVMILSKAIPRFGLVAEVPAPGPMKRKRVFEFTYGTKLTSAVFQVSNLLFAKSLGTANASVHVNPSSVLACNFSGVANAGAVLSTI